MRQFAGSDVRPSFRTRSTGPFAASVERPVLVVVGRLQICLCVWTALPLGRPGGRLPFAARSSVAAWPQLGAADCAPLDDVRPILGRLHAELVTGSR
jgi:hypothetical protein